MNLGNHFSFAIIVGDNKSRLSNFIKMQDCKKVIKDQYMVNDDKIREIIRE